MALVTGPEFLAFMPQGTEAPATVDRMGAALAAAQQAIIAHCGRTFDLVEVGAVAAARSFRPTGCRDRWLSIHDCTSITSVVEAGVTLAAGVDFIAEPLDGLDSLGQSVPFTALTRTRGGWYHDDNLPTVTVTAIWGYAPEADGVPAAVREACKLLAKDILFAREMSGDVAGFNEFGSVRLRRNPQIAELLAPFRRFETLVGFA